MTYYSQLDPRWKNKNFTDGYSFGRWGCFVTSLAMIADKEPPETAQILEDNGCFNQDGLLDSVCAASAKDLGLEYHGKSTTQPEYPCIAETTYYAPNTPQHFFVVMSDGNQFDPLGKNIKYPIKSYRLFKAKGDNMSNGFDDNHIRKTLENDFRTQRDYFGLKDAVGLKADVDFRLQQMKDGSTTASPEQFLVYVENQKRWIKKTDCPKCDCSKIEKEMTEAHQVQIALISKDYEKKTKKMEKESIQIMKEQDEALELADKVVKGYQSQLDTCQKKLKDCKQGDEVLTNDCKLSRWEHFKKAFGKR